MAKRTSKAEIILQGARERVGIAEQEYNDAAGQLEIAKATLSAHMVSLSHLERDLAQTPRKVNAPKSSALAASRRSSPKQEREGHTVSTEESKVNASPALCAIKSCGGTQDHADHQPGSPNYHVFRTEIKKRGKDNGAILPDVPEDFVHGATA